MQDEQNQPNNPIGSIPFERAELDELIRGQKRLRRSVRLLGLMLLGVAMLAVVSLGINFLLVTRLLRVRSDAAAMIENASRSLDNLSGQGLAFDVPISQTVNVEGDIPFKQDLAVPIKTNVPVNTTVTVPLNLGPLGSQDISVPVNTTIPVDITVPIHVEQTVHVKTQLPVRMTFPVRLSANDPPLRDWIAQVRQWLGLAKKYLS